MTKKKEVENLRVTLNGFQNLGRGLIQAQFVLSKYTAKELECDHFKEQLESKDKENKTLKQELNDLKNVISLFLFQFEFYFSL